MLTLANTKNRTAARIASWAEWVEITALNLPNPFLAKSILLLPRKKKKLIK